MTTICKGILMKHVFIVNPLAGGGKSLRASKRIEEICKRDNLDYIIRYTSEPMDATRITKEYKEEECIIYSVGGDGTMNEVLNGIVGSKNLFAIVPAGSGNDFTKALNAIDEIKKTIDIGKINERYFLNVACIGIDAEVASNAHQLMKKVKIPPSQIYNVSILYTFIKYRFKEMECRLNSFYKKDKFTMLAVCNGRFYGGGFQIAPKAELSDGLFDVYFVSKLSKLRIPYLILKLLKCKHEGLSSVEKKQSNSVVVHSDEDIICNVDGEILIGKQFDIKIIENAVTLYNDKKLINEFMGV